MFVLKTLLRFIQFLVEVVILLVGTLFIMLRYASKGMRFLVLSLTPAYQMYWYPYEYSIIIPQWMLVKELWSDLLLDWPMRFRPKIRSWFRTRKEVS